jgi:hypothetical protein
MRLFPLFACSSTTAFECMVNDTARQSMRKCPDLCARQMAFVRGQHVGRITNGQGGNALDSKGETSRAA